MYAIDIASGPDQDFYKWTKPVDWIVSNPPWSDYRDFTKHAFTVAKNIVWLVTLNHAMAMRARLRDMREADFGIAAMILLDTPKASDYPNWPQSGFQLGAVWYQAGYKGDIEIIDEHE